MPAHPRLERTIDWMLSRWVHVLAAAYLLFVLLASLIPLDFDFGAEAAPFASDGGAVHLPDTVANIFLYVPLGILLSWSWVWRLHRGLPAAVAAVGTAAALSLGVEWVQAYSATRMSTLVDVAANATGAGLGAFVSLVCEWSAPRLKRYLLEESCARPRETALRAYCVLLFVFAVAPFSFMLDPPRLAQAWREASFVPFAPSFVYEQRAAAAATRGDWADYAYARQLKMHTWLGWSLELISFSILAWLLQSMLVREYGFPRAGSNLLAWWIGLGLAALLSLLQWPVRLRGFDATDIVMRATGLAVGLVTRWAFVERMRYPGTGAASSAAIARAWLNRAGVAVAALIVISGLIPFEFDRQENAAWNAVASPRFLPGVAYFTARFDTAMADLLFKLSAYTVLTLLFIASRPRLATGPVAARMGAGAALCVTVAAAVEVAQLWLAGRTASLTDPLIALSAAMCGAALHHALTRFFTRVHDLRTVEARAARGTPPPASVTARRPWTLTDALVAGLIDDDPDAPREPGRPDLTPHTALDRPQPPGSA